VGLQYAGELIAAFIERAGGSVKGKISTGAVPEAPHPPGHCPIAFPTNILHRTAAGVVDS
jgi:hypothetical protein